MFRLDFNIHLYIATDLYPVADLYSAANLYPAAIMQLLCTVVKFSSFVKLYNTAVVYSCTTQLLCTVVQCSCCFIVYRSAILYSCSFVKIAAACEYLFQKLSLLILSLEWDVPKQEIKVFNTSTYCFPCQL